MKSIRYGRVALAVAGIILLAACADEAPLPLSPSAPELGKYGARGGQISFFEAIQRVRSRGVGFDSELVTVEKGGELEAGGVTLSIPPGAVSEDVTIRMIVPNTPFLYAHFQPHGLEFETPATLTFDLSDAESAEGGLLGVYVGSGLFTWGRSVLGSETFPVTPTDKGASFPIDHFSGYIVASGTRSRGSW